MYGDLLFNGCNLFAKGRARAIDDILKELHTDEATLVLGYRYVILEKYEEAANIFEKFYKGDNTLYSINAGYCLGIMRYYGKGYPVDKSKGLEMLMESYNKGIFIASILKMSNPKPLPTADRVIKTSSNFCGRIEELSLQ
jgi:TPR repeat protein